MKILKLHIKNLNSLNVQKTIDFTKYPLANTGLFAIIGPTGSGKSTMLDAISLALYGEIPRAKGRITKKIITDNGFIMSRNAKECYAAVDYETEEKKYRSKWSISTNRNGKLRDHEMELSELPENKIYNLKKSEVPTKNEKIIGLNYEQFVKSIILSQGEFAKFLKANKKNRSVLLEKITGTEIYRKIGIKVFEKQKTEKIKLEKIETELNAIEIISHEIIKNKQNEIVENQNNIKNLSSKLNELNKYIQIKTEIKNLCEKQIHENQKEKENQKKINENKNDFFILEQHNKLINKQKDIHDYKTNENNSAKLKQKLKKETAKNIRIKNDIQNIRNEKEIYKNEKTFAENNLKKMKPIFIEVKNTDYKIKEKNNRNSEQKIEFEKIKIEFTKNIKITESIKKQINSLEINKKEISVKIEKNKILENLTGDLPLIKEKLNIYKQVEIKLNRNLKLNENINFIRKLENEKNQKNNNEKLKIEKKQLAEKIEKLKKQTKYKTENLNEIRKKIEKKRKEYSETEKLIKIQNNYKNKIEKLKTTKNELEILKSQIKNIQNEIPKYENEIKINEKYKEELEKKYEREQLEKKYKDDRLKLKKNEACWLCGATEHPYIQEYKKKSGKTKKQLSELKNELNKINKKLNTLINKKTEKITFHKQIEKRKTEIKKEIKDLSAEYQNIIHENKLEIKICEQEKSKKIKENIIAAGNELKKQIILLEKIINLKNNLEKITGLQEHTQNIITSENDIQKLFDKYKSCIPENETNNKKTEKLKRYLINFQKEKEKFENIKRQIHEKNTILNEKKQQTEKQKNIVKEKENILKINNREISNLQKKRFDLLQNNKPEIEEKKLLKKIENTRKNINILKQKTSGLISDLKNNNTEIENLKTEIEKLDENIETKKIKLLSQIKKIGYNDINSAQKNILNEKKAENIRKIKQKLENQKLLSLQKLSDLQSRINAKKEKDLSKSTYENLMQKTNEFKINIRKNNQKIGALKNKINENHKRTEKYKTVKKRFEICKKEYKRRKLLNEYIGDAKGNKFSAFAQELTLIQLIKFANKHFINFSGRYLLKKKHTVNHNEEDLIVMDTYLGNSERSVITLSGGESFLASLSLALGLSDLAGGSTKLQSLFIDEGFGSLDPESLDDALNTLEKLQNETNRTIGIISHVQALKERINTRIEMIPASSGYSKIEIKN